MDMAIRPIVTVPNDVLRQKAEKVTKFDDETKKLIKDLEDTVLSQRDPEGAGLAAPQIGVLKRVVLVRNFMADPNDPSKEVAQNFVLVNPKIVSKSKETIVDWEACLSIPNTYGKVERYKKVKVKALDADGEDIRLTATGYFAAIVQHEMDHLDGILFTDKTIGNLMTEEEIEELYSKAQFKY